MKEKCLRTLYRFLGVDWIGSMVSQLDISSENSVPQPVDRGAAAHLYPLGQRLTETTSQLPGRMQTK